MLIVYLSNDGEAIEWGDAPSVGDASTVGTIASLEFYKGELETVCIAFAEPVIHDDEETFNVQIAPDHSVITYGFSMIGRPPTGRLMDYEPTGDGDGMKAIPSSWYVDTVDTCTPLETGTYKAVHLCHCVNVGQLAAA
ncbi:MAG: hypothetical protein DCF22_18925 [Leptolyngbya sp.]|nr:MAG: hypothetical protein DCF22_18925 [Leptolyngbya sp.]